MAIEEIKLLEKLDYRKQLTFAYLTCERLYPNYVFFSEKFSFGNSQVLRAAIDLISDFLLTLDFATVNEIEFHLNEIDINTPFPHNFETILASSALDACTAISETLDFMIDKSVSRLKDISTFATDTVDMYVQESGRLDYNVDPLFEDKILSDPLMQRELSIQKGIISYLIKIDALEAADIGNLLSLQYNDNKSNLDLS
jgi:uncharacterized protein YjaG (DUF416 family)